MCLAWTRAALVILAAVIAAAMLGVGSARSARDIYLVIAPIEGEYDYSGICDVGACGNVYRFAGSGPCLQGCTGFPSSADVTINVSGAVSKTFPPSPCISKSVSGTFSIAWSDATTSSGTLSGRSHDGKAYSLSGTISGGAYAGGSISALVGFPPSPCVSGSFTGGFTLFPPGPPA
jgi:hypothetical protein